MPASVPASPPGPALPPDPHAATNRGTTTASVPRPRRHTAPLYPACSALRGQQRRQLALGVHFAHDVGAADELALDVELRVGRPARVLLQPLAQLGIGEDVVGLELHAGLLEDTDDGRREP